MSEAVTGVGIIGCGFISAAYLKAARLFPQIEIRALADLEVERAQARSGEFGVTACGIEDLLGNPAIDIVLNLTTPAAHVPVGLQAIAAGKHVYGEKPLAISTGEAQGLLAAASAGGVRVGCAPDTFLGGGHQTARRVLDQGAIGEPVGGTAFLMLPGHEVWHPDPDFYYARAGGGPMFDMGPYYLTDLVQLLGPVSKAVAFGIVGRAPRVIGSGPRTGTEVPVECTTHIAGLLQFAGG
ncbi:MAG: Gfo/Idh/MocA family oxidoreductase, partial [Pseudomonadota bacterium]